MRYYGLFYPCAFSRRVFACTHSPGFFLWASPLELLVCAIRHAFLAFVHSQALYPRDFLQRLSPCAFPRAFLHAFFLRDFMPALFPTAFFRGFFRWGFFRQLFRRGFSVCSSVGLLHAFFREVFSVSFPWGFCSAFSGDVLSVRPVEGALAWALSQYFLP